MEELLKILRTWLIFFFAEDRYKLAHSQVGPSFNDALIEFTSEVLRWRLVRDRSQILLLCRSAKEEHKEWGWYSADVLAGLLKGSRLKRSILTKKIARWFEEHLSEIENRFSDERLESTKKELARLERERAKELFG